jgi:hypothetical protein
VSSSTGTSGPALPEKPDYRGKSTAIPAKTPVESPEEMPENTE